MPKFCPECGKELISPDAEICPNCGVRIKKNPEKSPLLAALCSFIFAGLGQVYNGDVTRGALIFIGTLIGSLFFIIPGLIVWVYGIYDAYKTAKSMNAGEVPYRETNALHMILFVILWLIGIVVFIAVITVLISVTTAFITAALISSGSMNGEMGTAKSVAISGSANLDGTVTFTVEGGADLGKIKKITANFNDQSVGEIFGRSPSPGDSFTTSEVVTGERVILVGYFDDGTQQILYDRQF